MACRNQMEMNAIKLIHVTSPWALESILASGVFHAFSGHPLNGDSGLNCFLLGQPGNLGQRFEGSGAALKLIWEGPVRRAGASPRLPLAPNILHDSMPWRCFIPVDSDLCRPRIIGFKIAAWALDEYIGFTCPFWYPHWLRKRLYRRAKLCALRRFRGLMQRRQKYLKVAGP